ncbi:MAG: Ribonuclease D [Chroococcopsis gigantea SAG 12.99]|jgi:ribonuclease D|nr:ribonuclease D [Chlorogloea purpurea SAG 13.99]MDV3001643.1 Ribonuclease D [Chroococcopsis gigantea SAG 12.99]
MSYLTSVDSIKASIDLYSQGKTLWLDTEVAEPQSKKPRLSLISIQDDSTDLSGQSVTIIDVLDRAPLIDLFIEKIMVNRGIKKIFHNAAYDRKFLGGNKAENIVCTLKLARDIPYYLAPLPNYKLATLAEQLCHFPPIDKSLQSSDWGVRPLSEEQLNYAKLDPVYTAQVHGRLIQLSQLVEPDPQQENLTLLTRRYQEIFSPWRVLDTEIEHLRERIKEAMKAKKIDKTNGFSLGQKNSNTSQIDINTLARSIISDQDPVNFSLKLTSEIKKALGNLLSDLPVENIPKTVFTLRFQGEEQEDEEDIPF